MCIYSSVEKGPPAVRVCASNAITNCYAYECLYYYECATLMNISMDRIRCGGYLRERERKKKIKIFGSFHFWFFIHSSFALKASFSGSMFRHCHRIEEVPVSFAIDPMLHFCSFWYYYLLFHKLNNRKNMARHGRAHKHIWKIKIRTTKPCIWKEVKNLVDHEIDLIFLRLLYYYIIWLL